MTEKLTKPTLPRNVAEAIEKLRDRGWEQANLLNAGEFINTSRPTLTEIDGDHYGFPIAEWLSEDFHVNYPIYVSALVNGYTIEQSPEDKLRGVYSAHKKNAEITDGYGRGLHAGYVDGIETTLSILGIQIEGINAGGGS